jgi:hypothetical protein
MWLKGVRERPKLIKLEVKKGLSKQLSMKTSVSFENTLKTDTQINWKIKKKWINF